MTLLINIVEIIAAIVGIVLGVSLWAMIADAVHDEIDVNPSSVEIIALLVLVTFVVIVIHFANVIGINI